MIALKYSPIVVLLVAAAALLMQLSNATGDRNNHAPCRQDATLSERARCEAPTAALLGNFRAGVITQTTIDAPPVSKDKTPEAVQHTRLDMSIQATDIDGALPIDQGCDPWPLPTLAGTPKSGKTCPSGINYWW